MRQTSEIFYTHEYMFMCCMFYAGNGGCGTVAPVFLDKAGVMYAWCNGCEGRMLHRHMMHV